MKIPITKAAVASIILTGVISSTAIASSEKVENPKQLKAAENPSVQILLDKNPNVNSAMELVVFKDNKESKEIEAGLKINPALLDGQSIQEYKKQMHQYAKELRTLGSSKATATITFNSPMQVKEFEELIKSNKIEVEQFIIRTVDENGDSGTVNGVPSSDELVPEETLAKVLDSINANFVGIYAIEGKIVNDEANFNSLVKNPNVFLADVSHDIIENEVLKSKQYKALKSTDSKHHIDVNVSDFYWYVEQQK